MSRDPALSTVLAKRSRRSRGVRETFWLTEPQYHLSTQVCFVSQKFASINRRSQRRKLLLAHQIQRLPRSGYRRFQRLRRSKLREFVSVHMLLALTVGRARRFAHPIPLGRSLEHSSIFAAKLLDTFVANPCSGAVGIQVFCHHQISLRRRLEGSSGIEHDWFQLGGESCDGTWMADLMMGILAFRRGRP